MKKEEAINKLRECQINHDIEAAHIDADDILCEFLIDLGCLDVVDEWTKVGKWYA